jgi:hypothetical protein
MLMSNSLFIRRRLMTATIFLGCSAAAIFTPQKKRVFYMLTLGLVVLSLAVVSIVLAIFSIFVFSNTLEAVYTVRFLWWRRDERLKSINILVLFAVGDAGAVQSVRGVGDRGDHSQGE